MIRRTLDDRCLTMTVELAARKAAEAPAPAAETAVSQTADPQAGVRARLNSAAARQDISVSHRLANLQAVDSVAQKQLPDGTTPLMMAVLDNDIDEVMRQIVDWRVDLNAQNAKGETALMLAASENHFFIVMELLRAGVDVNLKDNKGQTALDRSYASHSRCQGDDNVPTVLKQAGARES